MIKILTLDLAEKTGWATNGLNCGFVSFKNKRHEGAGVAFVKFNKFLSDMNANHKYGRFDLIVFERIDFGTSTYAAQMYGGLIATMMAWCEIRGIPYHGVPPGTWKKHATGKGDANKIDAMFAAELLGFDPEGSEDAADAACLWDYAREEYKNLRML